MAVRVKAIRVEYDEQVALVFADLLTRAAEEYGAPAFAADLAEGGAKADWVEIMAKQWREGDFEPPNFADELRTFAQDVRKLHKGRG